LINKGIRRPTRATTATRGYSIYDIKEIFMLFVALVGRWITLFIKNGLFYL